MSSCLPLHPNPAVLPNRAQAAVAHVVHQCVGAVHLLVPSRTEVVARAVCDAVCLLVDVAAVAAHLRRQPPDALHALGVWRGHRVFQQFLHLIAQ